MLGRDNLPANYRKVSLAAHRRPDCNDVHLMHILARFAQLELPMHMTAKDNLLANKSKVEPSSNMQTNPGIMYGNDTLIVC